MIGQRDCWMGVKMIGGCPIAGRSHGLLVLSTAAAALAIVVEWLGESDEKSVGAVDHSLICVFCVFVLRCTCWFI